MKKKAASKTPAAPAPYSLPERMTIDTVESLAAELLQQETTQLNAAATGTITTAGIQLLIALDKHLAASGRGLSLLAPHASLCDAFRDAGLAALLTHYTTHATSA